MPCYQPIYAQSQVTSSGTGLYLGLPFLNMPGMPAFLWGSPPPDKQTSTVELHETGTTTTQ